MKSKQEVLRYLKNELKTCSGYSFGEEKFLIQLALNINLSQFAVQNEITHVQMQKIERALKKRKTGMPLCKIYKTQNFFGYEFFVNNNVLAPRKETEILVEQVICLCKNISRPSILDLCSGSGCIGIVLSKTLRTHVRLVDISPKANAVARKNAKLLGADVKICKNDMLDGIEEKFDIIVCNPPYIKTQQIQKLDSCVKNFDPTLALDGGEDGLEFYRYLAKNAKNNLKNCGFLALEIGFDQGDAVKNLFEKSGFETKVLKDYSNCDRIVIAKIVGEEND